MARKFGRAGKSARDMAEKRYLIRAVFVLAAGLATLFFLKALPSLAAEGIGALLIALVIFRLGMSLLESKIGKKIKEERRAIRGARGEERLEEILEELDENCMALHDVASPYGNIDHIVIGESGVFLIETKAHGGRVSVSDGQLLVNGRSAEKDFIAQTLRNSYWLKERILRATGVEPWINPIIVFTNAFVEWGRPIKGVVVTNRKFLLKLMARLRRKSEKNSRIWEMREKLTGLGG